jgi:hypothetical protein
VQSSLVRAVNFVYLILQQCLLHFKLYALLIHDRFLQHRVDIERHRIQWLYLHKAGVILLDILMSSTLPEVMHVQELKSLGCQIPNTEANIKDRALAWL